jgi:hypothetical protein
LSHRLGGLGQRNHHRESDDDANRGERIENGLREHPSIMEKDVAEKEGARE